jgi:hypothetical protein
MAYIYDLTDTWNAGGTTFYGIKMNVTNSASAAGSKLLSLQVSGSEKFGVDKDGNVGIGTSSPSYKLDIQTATSNTEVISRVASLAGANAASTVLLNTGTSNSYVVHKLNDYNGAPLYSLGGGPAVAAAYYSFDAHIWASQAGTERMRIDSSGNVGIGTASPGQALDVAGNIRASSTLLAAAIQTGYGVSTGDCAVEIGGDRTGSGPSYVDFHSTSGADFEARILRNSGANGGLDILNTGTGNMVVGQAGAGPLLLYTNNLERMRIKTDGQMRLVPLSGDPAGAENGDMYYNSTTHKFRGYANGSWVDLH